MNNQRHLRAAREMAALFRDVPCAVENTLELSARLRFELDDLGYEFPRYPVPEGETMHSFLKDKMGERLFPAGIDIVDDPHRKRGLRSKPFDGEGLANRCQALVEDGFLKTWVLDLRSARQLSLKSTG